MVSEGSVEYEYEYRDAEYEYEKEHEQTGPWLREGREEGSRKLRAWFKEPGSVRYRR
jgi:hypothetical protein